MKSTSPDYPLRLVALKEAIERALERSGRNWTLAIVGPCIHVLSDAEASEYNHRQAIISRRREARRFAKLGGVDASQLTDDERREHERRVIIDGRHMAAHAMAAKELRMISHQRSTPPMLAATE